MIFLNNYVVKNCYGYTACESVCPNKCIEMVENDEEFKYPSIDKNKCIKCNLCVDVCQDINYGTHLDENFLLKHISARKENIFELFRKSKHFQSNLGNTYHI